jgi:hypothetical protein
VGEVERTDIAKGICTTLGGRTPVVRVKERRVGLCVNRCLESVEEFRGQGASDVTHPVHHLCQIQTP